MPPAGFRIAAQQRLVIGGGEDEVDRQPAFPLRGDPGGAGGGVEAGGAGIHPGGKRPVGGGGEQGGQHRPGRVVHRLEAEILQPTQDGGLARARQAGDQHDLAGKAPPQTRAGRGWKVAHAAKAPLVWRARPRARSRASAALRVPRPRRGRSPPPAPIGQGRRSAAAAAGAAPLPPAPAAGASATGAGPTAGRPASKPMPRTSILPRSGGGAAAISRPSATDSRTWSSATRSQPAAIGRSSGSDLPAPRRPEQQHGLALARRAACMHQHGGWSTSPAAEPGRNMAAPPSRVKGGRRGGGRQGGRARAARWRRHSQGPKRQRGSEHRRCQPDLPAAVHPHPLAQQGEHHRLRQVADGGGGQERQGGDARHAGQQIEGQVVPHRQQPQREGGAEGGLPQGGDKGAQLRPEAAGQPPFHPRPADQPGPAEGRCRAEQLGGQG